MARRTSIELNAFKSVWPEEALPVGMHSMLFVFISISGFSGKVA